MFKRIIIAVLAGAMLFMAFACDNNAVAEKKNTATKEVVSTEEVKNENVYEGENMRFSWIGDMSFHSVKQAEAVKNVSALSKDKSVTVTNVLFKTVDAKSDKLFESVITSDEKVGEVSNKKEESIEANNGTGTKDILTYTFKNQETEGEYDVYVAAQIQSFENSYYIASVARIENPTEEKINQANTILNTIVYDENANETKAEQTNKEEMSDLQLIPYFSLQTYLLIEQNIDMFNMMKDFEIKNEQIEQSTSKELQDADGYKLMAKRELSDYSGNKCEIMVPKDAQSSDATYFFSTNEGVNTNISPAYEKNLEDSFEKLIDIELGIYEENKKMYKDIKKDEVVKTPDAIYQHINIKEVLASNNTQNVDVIVMVKKQDNVLVSYSIRINEKRLTGNTNALLEEMQKAYGVPLTQYGASEDALTTSGKAVDKDQENYVYSDEGEEIKQTEGFELMGETTIKNDNAELTVMALRGARTKNHGDAVYGKMHGVTTNIGLSQMYGDNSLMERTEKNVSSNVKFWKENPRDYTDVKDVKVSGDGRNAAVAMAGCKKTDYDGGEYDYYVISMSIDISSEVKNKKENIVPTVNIGIEVDTANTDSRTQLLYDEIQKAYGINIKTLIEEYNK